MLKAGDYAFYKGDKFLAIGTIKELAEEFSIKERSMRYYASSRYKKIVKNRRSNNSRVLFRIVDEGDI